MENAYIDKIIEIGREKKPVRNYRGHKFLLTGDKFLFLTGEAFLGEQCNKMGRITDYLNYLYPTLADRFITLQLCAKSTLQVPVPNDIWRIVLRMVYDWYRIIMLKFPKWLARHERFSVQARTGIIQFTESGIFNAGLPLDKEGNSLDLPLEKRYDCPDDFYDYYDYYGTDNDEHATKGDENARKLRRARFGLLDSPGRVRFGLSDSLIGFPDSNQKTYSLDQSLDEIIREEKKEKKNKKKKSKDDGKWKSKTYDQKLKQLDDELMDYHAHIPHHLEYQLDLELDEYWKCDPDLYWLDAAKLTEPFIQSNKRLHAIFCAVLDEPGWSPDNSDDNSSDNDSDWYD